MSWIPWLIKLSTGSEDVKTGNSDEVLMHKQARYQSHGQHNYPSTRPRGSPVATIYRCIAQVSFEDHVGLCLARPKAHVKTTRGAHTKGLWMNPLREKL